MCGEKELAQYVPVQYVGSPPHVRGKVPSICENLERMGITPACAGKSRIRAGRGAAFGDHPPPAYAGKSKIRRKGRWQHRDHPRVCGEKTQIGQVVHPDWGSPPRMRGKEVGVSGDGLQLGITPAYAGKSSPGLSDMHANGDHPRMCGEKARTLIVEDEPQGSPPHVRGKAVFVCSVVRYDGITPACAGKSPLRCCFLWSLWDHPRMCGEKPKKIP